MSLIEPYFAGKTAAISGAGDGIGRALSQRLNAAGCHLWLSDINPETLAGTCALLDDTKGRVTSQVIDCGQRDALFSWAEAVRADTASLHALFNNAGVGYGARFADSRAPADDGPARVINAATHCGRFLYRLQLRRRRLLQPLLS